MSNLNHVAKEIARQEAGKKQVSIAQIKEILKIVGILLVNDPDLVHSLHKAGLRAIRKEQLQKQLDELNVSSDIIL